MVQGHMGRGARQDLRGVPCSQHPGFLPQTRSARWGRPRRGGRSPPDPQARTLRHRPRFCQGHISGLGMDRPGCGGRGRRLHGPPLLRRRPVASAELPRADDANGRPGRNHWRATGGSGGALGTVRRAGSGPGAGWGAARSLHSSPLPAERTEALGGTATQYHCAQNPSPGHLLSLEILGTRRKSVSRSRPALTARLKFGLKPRSPMRLRRAEITGRKPYKLSQY